MSFWLLPQPITGNPGAAETGRTIPAESPWPMKRGDLKSLKLKRKLLKSKTKFEHEDDRELEGEPEWYTHLKRKSLIAKKSLRPNEFLKNLDKARERPINAPPLGLE